MKRQHLEFVTSESRIAEMFPPVPAGECLPDWWKQQPAAFPIEKRRFPHLRLNEHATIKACPGVFDYMSLGYVIPLWADMLLEAQEEGYSYEMTYEGTKLTTFEPHAWDKFPRQPKTHSYVLKIMTPWRIVAPKGWSVMALPPWYHQDDRWSLMPGCVDVDRFSIMTFVAAWHAPIGRTELLKAGTPLIHLVPYRRDSLPLNVTADAGRWESLWGRGMDIVGTKRLALGVYRGNRKVQ